LGSLPRWREPALLRHPLSGTEQAATVTEVLQRAANGADEPRTGPFQPRELFIATTLIACLVIYLSRRQHHG